MGAQNFVIWVFFTCILGGFFLPKAVNGAIECHYCGPRKLCTLPYDEEKSERITCEKSCMKFDGKSETDGKRVLVRSCGER